MNQIMMVHKLMMNLSMIRNLTMEMNPIMVSQKLIMNLTMTRNQILMVNLIMITLAAKFSPMT